MDYDISQSFPSRSIGTQDAENRRIERIAHELRRCCGIHEAQFGTGKDSISLSDAEAHVVEGCAAYCLAESAEAARSNKWSACGLEMCFRIIFKMMAAVL